MLAKQLAKIVENDQIDEIVPLLQNLGDRKKEILPSLKKLFKEYSEFITQKGNDGRITMSPKAKGDQLLILSITAFVCCDEKGFSSMYSAFILSKPIMDKLLPWYCPPWFSSFINKYSRAEYIPFDYELYLEWVDNKYVQASDELIAKLLPAVIFQPGNEKFKKVFAPQNLLKNPVTLDVHIWLIFQYESFIHGSDRYMSFSDGSTDGRWIRTFQELTEKGLLERKRVLREALLATNRNFNQALSGWFSQLFTELNPQLEELCDLHSELLNSLNSNSSKQVNATLKYLKKLIEIKREPDNLIDYLNLTITSSTKSVVLATLACIEEMAKRQSGKNASLCHLASLALIHPEEAIQIKTAKFIQKYGDETNASLREAINPFSDSLFANSKSILSSFINNKKAPAVLENQEECDEDSYLNAPAKIEPIENFEDLLFLTSQAFDNNESWHFEQLCNSLLLMQESIKGDNINKLSPALQRAFKVLGNDFRMGIGFLDHLLATFFIEYSAMLIERFPSDSTDLQKLFNKHTGGRSWKEIAGILYEWQQHNKSAIYQPFKELLIDVLNFLKQSLKVPLLCYPDYYPCRVSGRSLVERLKIYQSKKVQPSLIDFQIAVSRMFIPDPMELKQLTESGLKEEFKDILSYLGSEASVIPNVGVLKPVWLIASVQKSIHQNADILSDLSALRLEYITGNFKWQVSSKQRPLRTYDMELQKYVESKEMVTDRKLQIIFPEKFKEQTVLNKIVSKIINNAKNSSIYDHLEMSGWISAEAFDIKRLLYLVPENPSPVLAQVLFKSLVFSKCWEEAEKRLVTKTLEALLEVETYDTEMLNLFIAACMLNSDKTIASYAAELWTRGISSENINNGKIGEMLGKLEHYEYGPLKRLTNLMLSNMFKISPKHNLALETLITSCISELSDKPISNTKKLLELYRELLIINNTGCSDPSVIQKLEQWKLNAGLKKTVEGIL